MKLRILEGGVLELTVRDWGPGHRRHPPGPAAAVHHRRPERSGMGFTIMESFMDRLTVKSTPGKGHHRVHAQAHRPAPVRPAMSGGQLFALLDRAQNGDNEACETGAAGKQRTDLEHCAAVLWLRGGRRMTCISWDALDSSKL